MTNLLKTADVCSIFDVTPMSIHRWTKDQDLGFPQPFKVKTIRFWRLGDIEAFIERQSREAA